MTMQGKACHSLVYGTVRTIGPRHSTHSMARQDGAGQGRGGVRTDQDRAGGPGIFEQGKWDQGIARQDKPGKGGIGWGSR